MNQIIGKKRIEDLEVTGNKWLNEDYFVLTLRSEEILPDIRAGQFTQVKVEGSPETFLRRPISFYDVHPSSREIRLLIRKAGAGTKRLSALNKGEKVNMIYPLGRPFSLLEGNRFLLVGGGVGLAPLYLLGKELHRAGKEIVFLFGFRSAGQLFDLSQFKDLGELYLTTEDGSKGEKGLVTGHPVMEQGWDAIYTCGPEPMMKVIAAVAAEKGVPCEASLETLMGCGFGACLCCAVETVHGMQRACVEGPVFNTKELLW